MKMESIKLLDLADYSSAATDKNGSGVDMQGFEWVIFVYKFAVIAAGAVTTIKLQESTDNGVADTFADLEDTGISVAADDDNQMFGIGIYRPNERYVRPVVDKDTSNATAEVVLAICGGGGGPNLASVTDEITIEMHYSPAQGTA